MALDKGEEYNGKKNAFIFEMQINYENQLSLWTLSVR